jgi:hypothetical protein
MPETRKHKRNPYMDSFSILYRAEYGLNYDIRKADAVQLAHLFQAQSALTPETWERALLNYYRSEITHRTLADFCTRFPIFYRYPIDRFKQPLRKPGGHTMTPMSEQGSIAWQIRFLQRANKLWDSDKSKRDAIEALYDAIEKERLDETEATKRLAAIEAA